MIERQKLLHKQWVEEEGGIEGATHIETLQQPEQQKRIAWLKKHCDSKNILDIGCNWGYILDVVEGTTGIDINPENTKIAKEKFPSKCFLVADVTEGLLYRDNQFDIVILADILEHLDWFVGVGKALQEALRIAQKKVLITLPWKQTNRCALCFKHKWVPAGFSIGKITGELMPRTMAVERDENFLYIEVFK